MTTNQLPIIILVDERDDILHTAEWPQCKDSKCPCQFDDLWQDEVEDVPPTEAQLDEQERAVLAHASCLAAQLDGFSSRLVEIAAAGRDIDGPRIRAGVVAEGAITAIWSYVEEPTLKASLARLMNAFTLIK